MNYKRTMTFLLICSKQEGLQCTDREDDHPSSVPLGSASLAKWLEHRRCIVAATLSCTTPEIMIATLIACNLVICVSDESHLTVIKWYPEPFENQHV
jgi:hypothetical protein